jgi:hypothetical protein
LRRSSPAIPKTKSKTSCPGDSEKRQADINRVAGERLRTNANGFLKANGYAVEFITNRLECRGQTLVGVSAPYLALIRARKLTNEFNENIEARFSSPSLGHQTYHVTRTINYTMPESAPTAAATEKSFIEKYGNIVTTQTTPAGHISQMTWEVPNALLVATFGYASNNPGVIQSIRMEQTRYAARQPMDVVRQEQIKICGVTRHHDEARIKQRNQQGSTAPKL